MAYIQILAIVLCSCFVQDAISLTRVRKVTSIPANGLADLQFTDADGQQETSMPPVRRTIKRMVSKKSPEAADAPPPPQPSSSKYPNLTAVKDMFWNTFEEINQAGENGKLGVRSVRNMMDGVLDDERFWSSLVMALRRRVKVTNDSERADKKIRMCNALTSAITSPNASQGLEDVANEVYGMVSRIRSDVGTGALQLATEMVNGGEVNRGLDTISSIVNNLNFDHKKLIKRFGMLRRTLALGGAINMSGGLSKGLMAFTSNFNK